MLISANITVDNAGQFTAVIGVLLILYKLAMLHLAYITRYHENKRLGKDA